MNRRPPPISSSASSESELQTSAPVSNTVAVIGLILLGVAAVMTAVLFVMADRMPQGVSEFQQAIDSTPAQLRLLIVGCSTAVLILVSFVLCAVGLFLPQRPRLAASIGTALSLLLLLSVFGVLLTGVLMNPG